MLHSSKKSAKINAFEQKVIPRTRDLFDKYGTRVGGTGSYNSTPDNPSPPVSTSKTVIGQLVDAQNLLSELSVSAKK